MRKRNVVNIALLLTAIALLVAGAMFVRIRPIADRVVVLSTAGMTCEKCGSVLERGLSAEKGVAGVEIDLNGRRVIVAYDSKATRPSVISSTVGCLGYRNSVADCLSVEQYRKLTGKVPGLNGQAGCGVCCVPGK